MCFTNPNPTFCTLVECPAGLDTLNAWSDTRKMNEIIDLVSLKDGKNSTRDKMIKKIERLEKEGVDIYGISYRKLGELLGDKHPQTAKDQLLNYLLYKKGKEFENCYSYSVVEVSEKESKVLE